MNYEIHKVDGQTLMFAIVMTHKDEDITFNVVCAHDESEIPDLVSLYLNYLDNPPKPPSEVAP